MISIIIPTFNEGKYIKDCLKGVSKFNIPEKEELEILVIDGSSTDNTISIVKDIQSIDQRIKIINNPNKIQSSALNIGIRQSRGEWVLRLDAHANYPKDYLNLCFKTMLEKKVENVGGLCITKPGGDFYQAHLVQALCTHKFGVGNSAFRTGSPADYVDTVPYGFFKKTLFQAIGYFDERLVRAQDFEFNKRIVSCGGKIWLNPEIQAIYFNKPTLKEFLVKQFFSDAPYNAYMWYLAPYTFVYRHAITAVFSLGFICGVLLSFYSYVIKILFLSVMLFYFFLSLVSSIQQAILYKQKKHVLFLPISFFFYHFIHGLGVSVGLFKLFIQKAPVQDKKIAWKGFKNHRIKIKKIF